MQERFFSDGMDIGGGLNLLTGEALLKGVTGVVTPNHNEFEDFDADVLRHDRDRLVADFDRITKEATDCMRDATKCNIATFGELTKPLPRKLAG